MRRPIIPMSAAQLPKQRIVTLADLGERPVPFDAAVGWNEKPAGSILAKGPSKPDYLGQVEWSWSPMHGRIDAYYLSRGRTHWILWLYSYDDNWGNWDWLAIGNVPLRQANKKQASIHLMADFWRMEKTENDLDHYHSINEEDFLGAGEWRTIGLLVWPEVATKAEKAEGHANEN